MLVPTDWQQGRLGWLAKGSVENRSWVSSVRRTQSWGKGWRWLKRVSLEVTDKTAWSGLLHQVSLAGIVGLNYRLDGVDLVCDVNKPFDVLLNQPEW